uniref:Uncharacterized protein n=2 Tax=Chenopodium quinoa TaxID=63459 RepID=A0A803LZZ2_CHEQI
MPASSVMQQNNLIIQLDQIHQDHRFGHHNVLPSAQQYCSVKEQNRVENCQQPSQFLSLPVSSHEQSIQFPDARLQESHMPSTSPHSQTLVGKNKHSSQSQMTSAKAASASVSFPDAGNINAADWKLLIDQYQRARSTYLPELNKLLKRAEEQCFQGQNAKQLETVKRARDVIKLMIKFLHIPESELLHISKEIVYQYLNQIIQYFNSLSKKSTTSSSNQAPQSSHGQILVNNVLMTPLVNTTLIRKPMSQRPEDGSSHSQPGVLNSPLYDSAHATKQVDMKTLQLQVPEDSADKNVHLNVKKNPQQNQITSVNQTTEVLRKKKPQNLPEKKSDYMNSMFPPMTKATSRTICQQSSGTCLMSAKPLQSYSAQPEKKRNASFVLDHREMSHPKPIVIAVDSPSTPITPTSAPKEIVKSAMSVSPTKFQASKAQCETEVQDKDLDFEAPGVLASPLPSDSIGPENNQLPHCAKRPFERLIQAVQRISKEALRSSMDDIASAMSAVNNLPAYANDVDSPAVYCSTGDGYTSCKKMKRDINSVRGVVSALKNYGSCRKKSRKEVNNDLMDGIRQTNQRLIETVLKVYCDFDSSHDETIIKCTYKPVSCSGSFKRHFGFMESMLTLSIEILVPSYYPNTALKILDRQPDGCCKETKDLTEKARARFDRCIRGLVSLGLGDMARAWDDSARSVISDFTLGLGGESFSSKYGTWECVSAV